MLLADEPTASLDAAPGYQVLHLLQDIARSAAKAVIIVTHDHRVTDAADRLLWLADDVLHDLRYLAGSPRAGIGRLLSSRPADW